MTKIKAIAFGGAGLIASHFMQKLHAEGIGDKIYCADVVRRRVRSQKQPVSPVLSLNIFPTNSVALVRLADWHTANCSDDNPRRME
jgi:nucleoside-diphosphate-sugar epimerase